MKKKLLLGLLAIFGTFASIQGQVDNKQSFFKTERTDLGLGLGGTFYMGDFNKIPFTNPRYYGTVFHRYSFDMLYSLRTSVAMGKVAGGANSNDMYMPFFTETFADPDQYPNGHDVRFERTFVDFSIGVEIGLRAFDAVVHRIDQTLAPYLFLGVGLMIAYPDSHRDDPFAAAASNAFPKVYGTRDENSGSIQALNIPIGLGLKWSPKPRWTIGLEWQFKKTFNDRIDRFDNSNGGSKLTNGDWVSLFGLNVSYRLMPKRACPAIYKYDPPKRFLQGINRQYDDYDKASNKKKKK